MTKKTLILSLLIYTMLAIGCASRGTIVKRVEDVTHKLVGDKVVKDVRKETIEIRQPKDAKTPATLNQDTSNGTTSIEVSGVHELDLALIQLNIWVVAGLVMTIGGIVYWVLMGVFPALAILPRWAAPILTFSGPLVASVPMLLDRYSGWLAAGFGAVVVVAFIYSIAHNKSLLNKAKQLITPEKKDEE